MHLIKNDITELGVAILNTFCIRYDADLATLFDDAATQHFLRLCPDDYSHVLDFTAAAWIAERAQTFLFDTDQALQFIRSIDRKLAPGDYAAPFQHIIFQFSSGIPEQLFTAGLKPSGNIDVGDTIQAIILSVPDTEQRPDWNLINVVAWYKSTSLNRVQLPVSGDGTIEYVPISGTADDVRRQDKQRLANLAMLLLAYLNTPGMSIEHVQTPARVNRKRERDGKRVLPDYYVCKWHAPHHSHSIEHGTGTSHSIRYDVAGHFRRLPDGKTIWIRAHQRGLANERYVPKVYRVD